MPRQICPHCRIELDVELHEVVPDSCTSCGQTIDAPETRNHLTAVQTLARVEQAESTAAFFFGSDVPASTVDGERSRPAREVFGRYQVEQLLGQGAFGLVYRGFDPVLQRLVAIKVPKRARIAREEDVQAYMEEARILAGLDHPGIVAVYDLGRTEDQSCYVVSKFIPGGDLEGLIRKQPPSLVNAVSIVAQAAEALDHAHSRGLVHRDIKPANLLIDQAGQVCVADFGLAITPEDFGLAIQVAGTPAYMSPEQIRGDIDKLDGRSDLFSLGVVLYQLLTGRRPFEADHLSDLLQKILEETPRFPYASEDRVPRALIKLCMQCLAKRKTDRPASAGELAARLREIQEGLEALPPSPSRIFVDLFRAFETTDAQAYRGLVENLSADHPIKVAIDRGRMLLEGSDPSTAVVILHGPAGSGKTSIGSAGLLEGFKPEIRVVQTSGDRDQAMGFLIAKVEELRVIGHQKKILVVIDHLERLLRVAIADELDGLAELVRSSDGIRVQVLLIVRDDALKRAVDLAGPAKKGGGSTALLSLPALSTDAAFASLHALGHRLGMLPSVAADLSRDQRIALKQVVSGLESPSGIPVGRLARFARTIQREWIPLRLSQAGGVLGLAALAIDESIARLDPKLSEPSWIDLARLILANLLPFDSRASADGREGQPLPALPRSTWQPGINPAALDAVLRMLEDDLRLIGSANDGPIRSYRLTDRAEARVARHWLATNRPPVRPDRRAVVGDGVRPKNRGRESVAPIPLLKKFEPIKMTDKRFFLPVPEEGSPLVTVFWILVWCAAALAITVLLRLDGSRMLRVNSRQNEIPFTSYLLFEVWKLRWWLFWCLLLTPIVIKVTRAIAWRLDRLR